MHFVRHITFWRSFNVVTAQYEQWIMWIWDGYSVFSRSYKIQNANLVLFNWWENSSGYCSMFMNMIDTCAMCMRKCVFRRRELGVYEISILWALESWTHRTQALPASFLFDSLGVEYSRLIIFSASDEYSRHWINLDGIFFEYCLVSPALLPYFILRGILFDCGWN